MKARRTVELTRARCRNDGAEKDYWPGPSAYHCGECPFFGGRLGDGGPSTDKVWCAVDDAILYGDNEVRHPVYNVTYEVWREGMRQVKAEKKKP